jgi:hypothetical protein
MRIRIVLLSLSLAACGGAVVDGTSTASSDAGTAISTHTKPGTGSVADAGASIADAGAAVVWAHAAASGFDPRACQAPGVDTDFGDLSSYVYTELTAGGLEGAPISAGGGTCQFGSPPTTLSETDVFTGPHAAVRALLDAPPLPFHGTYIDAPIVVKEATNVKFEFFVGDGAVHVFSDVWVHEGLDLAGEVAFMQDICNTKAAFDAAIATATSGHAVETWIAARSEGVGYQLGYDATFTFTDGTTTTIQNANQAVGGPYMAFCPNLIEPP